MKYLILLLLLILSTIALNRKRTFKKKTKEIEDKGYCLKICNYIHNVTLGIDVHRIKNSINSIDETEIAFEDIVEYCTQGAEKMKINLKWNDDLDLKPVGEKKLTCNFDSGKKDFVCDQIHLNTLYEYGNIKDGKSYLLVKNTKDKIL
jgi:hypothetical protein